MKHEGKGGLFPRTASAKSVFTHFVEPENVARGE